MPTRILIADDNALVRSALRALIEGNPEWEVCGEALNGGQAVAKAFELRPDLVVLDFSMPVLNGLEAAREIGKLTPSIPMMLYSMFLTYELTEEARAAGCRAAVSKDTAGQLTAGIGAVLRHESFFPQ